MIRSRRDRCVVRPEPLERRVLFAAAGIEVAIGDGGSRSVSFVDADGTSATASVRGAAAVVRFSGEGLTQASSAHGVAVTGTGVTLTGVTASGTSRRSALSFTAAGGDGRLAVPQLTSDGRMGRVDGPAVVLTGPLTTGGPVGRLLLLSAQNASITLGGDTGFSSVAISDGGTDTDLTSTAPIRRLTLGSWTGADGGDAIAAPSIETAVVTGTFAGDISLSSAGSLDFGLFRNATLTVSGDVRSASFLSLEQSSVYVGVRPMPALAPVQSLSDFAAPSTIGRLRVRQIPILSSDTSVIAARYIGRVVIRDVLNDFGEFPPHFVIADRIDRVKAWAHTGHRSYPPIVRKGLENDSLSLGVLRIRAI
jgi:hypothetical protein